MNQNAPRGLDIGLEKKKNTTKAKAKEQEGTTKRRGARAEQKIISLLFAPMH